MSAKGVLMRLARRVLNQVLTEVNTQVNRIQQEVIQEVESYLRQVIDGAWRGEDAEQFKSELTNFVLPRLNELASSGGILPRVYTGIDDAAKVIERTDNRVSQLVGDLNETFSRIY